MKTQIFVVFDLKSKTTASQFIMAPNPAIVKRSLIATAGTLSPSIKKFPEDFAVFHLGEYDDCDLKITPVKHDEMCFSMKEVIDYADIGNPS